MSTPMGNLMKMFKAARVAAGESSDTKPVVTFGDMEAPPVRPAVLMAEDDDDCYIGWGHLEENPESILTVQEIEGWQKEFDLLAGNEFCARLDTLRHYHNASRLTRRLLLKSLNWSVNSRMLRTKKTRVALMMSSRW